MQCMKEVYIIYFVPNKSENTFANISYKAEMQSKLKSQMVLIKYSFIK